jgi:hypothetical protein
MNKYLLGVAAFVVLCAIVWFGATMFVHPPQSPQKAMPVVVQPVQTAPAYCTQAPTSDESGRTVLPESPEYQGLPFGELFTAASCGPERVKQVFGVKDGNYTLGARLDLATAPSSTFEAVLKDIGFVCASGQKTTACSQWLLDKSVSVDQMLRLKDYLPQIKQEDCVNCG